MNQQIFQNSRVKENAIFFQKKQHPDTKLLLLPCFYRPGKYFTKRLHILLFGAFVLCGLFPVQLYSNPFIECRKFEYPPEINGKLEEWKNFSPINLVEDKNYVVVGKDKWHGINDLSGKAFLGWDEDNLYIAILVTDDVINQTIRSKYFWGGDHVELFIGTDIQKNKDASFLNEDYFQIGLSPGNLAETGDFLLDIPPCAAIWFPKSKSGESSKLKIASLQTETGYIIEAAVPFSVLKIKPVDGLRIKMDICLSDTDDLENQETLTSLSSQKWVLRDISRLKYIILKP